MAAKVILSSCFIAALGIISAYFLFSIPSVEKTAACPRRFGRHSQSFACVCKNAYCDNVKELGDIQVSTIVIYTTSKDGQRLERTEQQFNNMPMHNDDDKSNAEMVFNLDPSTTFQTIVGFGGGFSDAFGINMEMLSEELKKELLNAYFGPEGIGYTMGRVPIGTSNFGSHSYTHNDYINDWEMQNYSLTEYDFSYKIKFLKKARDLNSGVLKLVATPWMAPDWLTVNRTPISSILIGQPGGQYYKAWANYICKFMQSYAELGLDVWGMTILNNPYTSGFPFYNLQIQSMSPLEEIDFIHEDLMPALQRCGFSDKVKIFVGDDQFTFLQDAIKTVLGDSTKSQNVHGIAAQWDYDWLRSPKFFDTIHDKYEDKILITTDSSLKLIFVPEDVQLGSWENAAITAKRIIHGLNHWMSAWLEGHLALDVHGGPHWAGFASDASIIINTTSGEFYKQPAYYAIAQFSKFILPGSKRIEVKVVPEELHNVHNVAFWTPDDNLVFVMYNSGDKPETFSIQAEQMGVDGTIDGQVIKTFIWKMQKM